MMNNSIHIAFLLIMTFALQAQSPETIDFSKKWHSSKLVFP